MSSRQNYPSISDDLSLSSYEKAYKEYLLKSGKSANTVGLYIRTYRYFCELFGGYAPNNLSNKHLEAFIDSLVKKSKGNIKKTQLYFLKQLRYFFMYLEAQGVSSGIASRDIYRLDSALQKELHDELKVYNGPLITDEDLVKLDLYWQKHTEEQTLLALRNRALLGLMADTGITVSEAHTLKIGNFKTESVMVRGRKMKLSAPTVKRVEAYLARRPDFAEDMFVSYSSFDEDKIVSHPFTARGIQRVVKQTAQEVGIGDDITPKVLRNSLFVKILMNRELGYSDMTKFFGLSPRNTSYLRFLARAEKEIEEISKV